MNPRRTLVMSIVLASACVCAQAQNLRFLEYSPSTYFNDEDWKLVRAAVRDALDNGAQGETTTWKNDDTGAHGSITPLESFEQSNTTCRRARVSNEANNIKATHVVGFCKEASSGEWKIVN